MKINILHLTLSMGTGGIETLILSLCHIFDKKIFNTSLLCLDEQGELFTEIYKTKTECYVENRKPGLDLKLIYRLAKFFKDKKIDIVHAHNQACAFYAAAAKLVYPKTILIVTEHSRHNTENKIIRQIEKKIISKLSNRWVCVNQELADKSVRTELISKSKLEVVSNGVDTYKYSHPNELIAAKLKKDIDVRSDEKVIVMVARLEKVKNHLLMIDSLQILTQEFTKLKLILVGEGACRGLIEEKVQCLKLDRFVVFLGVSKNIPEVLSFSDVFVLCSHSEGSPLALLEASVAGVPIVVTESSNSSGFIVNNFNGLVASTTPRDLAEAIRRVFSDRPLAAKLTTQAKNIVSANCSLDSTAARYEEIYIQAFGIKRSERV